MSALILPHILWGLLCGSLQKCVRNGSLASPFSSPMPFVVAFCLFSSLRCHPGSTKWHGEKIKASLFHSWVTITDGHVHSAKTNSSSDKHNRVERCRRKNLPGSPFIRNWLWKENSLQGQVLGGALEYLCWKECEPNREQRSLLSMDFITSWDRSHSCSTQLLHPVSHQVLSNLFLKNFYLFLSCSANLSRPLLSLV